MIRTHRPRRRGISTLWLLLTLPVFLTLLVFTVDIANLWLARVELENGLEAAALAAVREWGEAGGGLTGEARDVGVAYARANLIRGESLTIATNLAPSLSGDNPNANLACCPTAGAPPGGNLVFGTITEHDPLTFDAGVAPSCGVGRVLFDARAQGSMSADNAWGIAFLESLDSPSDLRIHSIRIDLQAGGGTGLFTGTATLSDDSSLAMAPLSDIKGFVSPADQIQFHFPASEPNVLTITFLAHDTGDDSDDGFAPGDRFRFGAETVGVAEDGPGLFTDSGDGVGYDHVRVYVTFKQGESLLTPVEATFRDYTDSSNACSGTPPVVHPSGIEYLPCPLSSAAKNNGQSYVLMNGSGDNGFAVRAQATVSVDSLARRLLGDSIGPYYITARVTARYSCSEDRAWLVRVKNFICTPSP